VEMRTTTIDVPKQDIITRDNVPVSVDAVVYFNVFDPKLAVLEVQDYRQLLPSWLRPCCALS